MPPERIGHNFDRIGHSQKGRQSRKLLP
jgi:hypothetical protein